ncbi:MAG: c(7)-type cytochrome triheme domain-containing protein [Pseudomonadota bacterium]
MNKLIATLLLLGISGAVVAAEKTAKGSTADAPSAGISAPPSATQTGVGPFNRLLKKPKQLNLPPMEDGIHDPANEGTAMLQPPAEVLADWQPRRTAGNGVNWVEALRQGKINPRYERTDPDAVPIVMDLNIHRPVRSAMPDVIFPHKQHTEWLDCSNCHPAIFIPQKGANQISMSAILLGQKCGVCHGKVAFPITLTECKRCHSKEKDTPYKDPVPTAAAAKTTARP